MATIPASTLVSIVPSVLSAGGSGVDVIAMVLTTSTRTPIGTVLSFPTGAAVASYFGSGSAEDIVANGGAGKGSGYFGGFEGASKIPASILFAQYNDNAVAAYIRGGNISALTLAQLQALSGSLDIVIDGYPRNAASVNLSASTSFTSAAGIIATALNAADPTEETITASIGATFTGSQSGTNLTTTSVTGIISVGDTVAGTGVASGTKIVSQTSGPAGGAGVYVTSLSGTASSASCTASSNVLDVTVTSAATIAPGQYVTGAGVASAVILAQLGGAAGGVGTYTIAGPAQQVASESMTITATPVAVTYDSVSGAFIVTSGITGAASMMGFATGTISASLKLTSATGAVLSQGAPAAVPAAFMNALLVVNSNWVTFMTAFDPDHGSGNTVKQAFAAWKNSKNNRFAYICFDTDITPTESVPATGSLGYILTQDNDSGTSLIYEATDLNLASFICGAAASIDFTQKNGRTAFAYRAQAGLVASVTDPIVAQNLGGDPQTPLSYGNGYNFYGAYGTANPNFTWFQRGLVTGPFRWLDSYINQVWLNNAFQIALLVLQQNARSIPYSTSGAGLIEAALADPIQAGLNFGAFGPDTLSSSQIAIVNGQAGTDIASALQTQGYYLQILPATPSVRSARTSPPCTFWYIDRGSVQAITLSSVALN